MREIVSVTVFDELGINSVFRPSELLRRREQKKRDAHRSVRLKVHAFLVQLLAGMLSARFDRTG